MPGLKTYSHLAHRRRIPSEYEVATTQLLYHPGRGFEVAVPLAGWYERNLRGSPLTCSDWEQFEDPRQTTYTRYVALQTQQEAHVEGVLRSMEACGYDRTLPEGARALLARAVAPLRFAFHGLQMLAAYVGQMAPSGRIAIASLLQAADEMRRLQRVAYRLGQLRRVESGFAHVDEESRALWQGDAAWQPLRRAIERMLVTYDWGEALVALNVCLKPLLDELVMVELPGVARAEGDYLLGEIFFSLAQDCAWQRTWTAALIEMAVADQPQNHQVLARWTAAWMPAAREAAAALSSDLGASALAAAERRAAAFRESLGLPDQPAPGEAAGDP